MTVVDVHAHYIAPFVLDEADGGDAVFGVRYDDGKLAHPQGFRYPVQATFLQGLIQCAAAALKIPMGQPRGLLRLAEQGTARLESVRLAAGREYMGLDLAQFTESFRAFAAGSPSSAEDRPRMLLLH